MVSFFRYSFLTFLIIVVISRVYGQQSFVDPSTGTVNPIVSLGSNYQLEFSDEFNDNTIDQMKWNIDHSTRSRAGRPGLSIEDWWWVSENAKEESGNLVLDVDKFDHNTMHCGSINSKNKYESTFGYYEVKIKIAEAAKGTHTAFWLQGQNMGNINNSGQDGAEVDVFESAWLDDFTKCVVHIDGYGPDKQANTKRYDTPNLHDGNYHTWGFLWEADKMTIYYDGVESASYSDDKWIPQVDEYLWLSDGASFGIIGDNFTSLPVGYLTSAYVDYIRVWRKTEVVPEKKSFWTSAAIDGGAINAIDGTEVSYVFDDTDRINWIKTSGGNQELFKAKNTSLVLSNYPQTADNAGEEGRIYRFNPYSSLSGGGNVGANAEYHRLIGNTSDAQTLYLSFISQVRKLNDGTRSFPIGFSEFGGVGGSATWGPRFIINNPNAPTVSPTGTYTLGIDKDGSSPVLDETKTYTSGTDVVFVVMKLTMDGISTNSNDIVELYTSTTFPTAEPSWDISVFTGTDLNVNAVFLREKMDGYFNAAKIEDHNIDIDEIRIADSWDGLFASFYENATWSLGLPNANINAVVEENLVMNANLTTQNLTIRDGVTVTVNAGSTLEVKGDMQGSGSLIVESGGSLITYEGKVLKSVTIKRKSSFADGINRYSFIGSPVADFNITDLNAGYHYSYNTLDDSYSPFNGDMEAGVGYTTAGKRSLEFIGLPNTGVINVTLNNTGNKFNFVANPYASAINRSSFVMANTKITGAIYLWDDGGSNMSQREQTDFVTVTNAGAVSGGSGGSGASFDQTTFIGSAQGFLVQANAAGNVTFTETMREIGGNADESFFRQNAEFFSVKLSLSNESASDETLIAFSELGSFSFDRAWDATKILVKDKLSLFTYLKDEKLAIQTLPLLEENKFELPLGIASNEDGQYQIAIKDMNLPDGYSIFIYDNRTKESKNITQSSAPVSIKNGVEKQFSLVILQKDILAIDRQRTHLKLYRSDDELKLHVDGLKGAAGMVIYDMSGRVFEKSKVVFNASGDAAVFTKLSAGVYIVKTTQGSAIYSAKFIH